MSAASAAQAAAAHKSEAMLFFVLLQLTVIVLAGRIGGNLAVRLAQSAAVGEIVIGIMLGPSLFGALSPHVFGYVFRSAPPEPMQILSQVGLILLMFQIGMEFEFAHLSARRSRTAVLAIAAASLVAPFALGMGFGAWSAPVLSPAAQPLASALFIATSFSITALPILGRIMIEFDMTRQPLGVIAISAAAINDVIGWLLLALVTMIATTGFDGPAFGVRVALVAAFCGFCWFGLRPALKAVVRRSNPRDGKLSNNLLGFVLAVIFIAAMTTYQLGIFAIFGGFIIGVLLHDEVEFVRAWKERIGHFVTVFFLPIFFTYTGLRTNIGGLDSLAAWGWCALTIVVATVGKFGGTYAAARWTGHGHHEACVLSIMMNTRALMELIVVNVGYDLGVISQQMFTMLVIMAVFSTIITAPGLRAWLPGAGLPVPARSRI